MAGEIEVYLQAADAFNRSKRKLAELASLLAGVASALQQKPDRVIFSNVVAELPAEASLTRESVSFNANDWLTPVEINQLLKEYHETRSKAQDAWAAVPQHMKANLKDPPEGMLPRGRR